MLTNENNPYLEQEVQSASPIRLRWLLLRRSVELCEFVDTLWQQGKVDKAASWLLRIRDILGELLVGVRDPENPLASQVADFYVFLLQLLTEVEETKFPDRLVVMKDLLMLERDTWGELVTKHDGGAQLQSAQMDTSDLGASQAPAVGTTQPMVAPTPPIAPVSNDDTPLSGGFSLEV